MKSPVIINHSWGQIIVEGFSPFKDVMLYPGGAQTWDWNATGTSHSNGIQPGDIAKLIEHGASVIILSCGNLGRLQVSDEAKQYLKKQGIIFHVHRTAKAIKLYNELQPSEPVGALIHTTC